MNLSASKLSQTTGFVIFGVLIVVLGGIYFSLSNLKVDNGNDSTSLVTSDNVKQVSEFVQSCVRKAAYISIQDASMYGGYASIPTRKVASGRIITSLSLDKRDMLYPSYNLMKTLLEQNIVKNSVMCFNHFSNLKGVKVTYDHPDADIDLRNDSIAIDFHMKTAIDDGALSYIEDYHLDIDTHFYVMYLIMHDILMDISEDPEWLNINDLYRTGFNLTITPANRSAFMIGIYDEYGLEDEPLLFMAGVNSITFEDPEFTLEGSYDLKQGEHFSLYLYPNQKLEWFDDTAMIDVVDGWINFTPLVKGNFTVNVRAVNPSGQEVDKNTIFMVK